MLQHLQRDAMLAWRGLARQPFYPTATTLMLALALAANVVAFGIFFGYVLHPLPFGQPSRLFAVSQYIPSLGHDYSMASPNLYRAVEPLAGKDGAAGLYIYQGHFAAAVAGKSRDVEVTSATPSFFTTLGVRPVLGRLPNAASGNPGGPPEAVISRQFWHTAYGGRPDVLGQSLSVDNIAYRITGVLPADFGFMSPADLWVAFSPPIDALQGGNVNYFLLVRLGPGISRADFDARLHDLAPEIEREESTLTLTPKGAGDREFLTTKPVRQVILANANIGNIPVLLQGTALFLLLLATANAANLAVVRNRARLPEFALRRILGARITVLLRLLVLEHLPVLLCTAAFGLTLGGLALAALSHFTTVFDATPLTIASGWQVYAAGLAAAFLSVLLTLLAPAWQISAQRLGSDSALGNRATLSKAARRAQTALGMLQAGLAATLLSGSIMLTASFYLMLTQPLGFQPKGRFVASVLFPAGRNNPAALTAAVQAVAGLPITKSAGGAAFSAYPFSDDVSNSSVSAPGASTRVLSTEWVTTSFGYLHTLGIPILSGRDFDQAAFSGAGANQVIISRDLALALFGRTDVLGQMIDFVNTKFRIIGITAPVVWESTITQGVHGEAYLPVAAAETTLPFIGFRDSAVIGNMTAPAPAQAMRAAIAQAVPGSVITSVRAFGDVITAYNAFRAVAAGLMAGFALLALVLAGFGVYAVNALIARARLPEFGMRAMLGASPATLLRLAMTDAGWVVAIGVGGGLAGGYFLVRAMASLLFEIGNAEAPIFLASGLVIAVIVLLAAWPPARRAARMPVKALLRAN